MNVTLKLWTDAASICVFDPAAFEGTSPENHWPPLSDPNVREGRFALVGLQGDCGFTLRLTDGDLTAEELPLVNDTVGPLGVVVRSGEAYASGMDWPGEPADFYRRRGAGGFFSIANGEFDVVVHELRLGAPKELPNYIAVFRARIGPFQTPVAEPCFQGGRDIEDLLRRLEGGGAD